MSEAVKPIVNSKFLAQWVLVGFLAGLVAIATLPSYFSGQWPWNAELQVAQLEELRALSQTPIPVAGWELGNQEAVRISRSTWGLGEYRQVNSSAGGDDRHFALLVRPQTSHDKQPEVEWVDLQGSQGWRVDDLHTVRFTLNGASGQSISVSARYFRGLTEGSTFAVMQWYAWPTGGHFAPGKWFWADQAQQWQHRERMPWVAVSILLPIEPVGDIRPHTETVIAIAQAVHQSLLTSALQ